MGPSITEMFLLFYNYYDTMLYIRFSFFSILMLIFTGCQRSKSIPQSEFYKYDSNLPLDIQMNQSDSEDEKTHHISFDGVYGDRITGLLSYPEGVNSDIPVIILIHGLGDDKTVDYIQAGEDILRSSGYAVLRIDLYNHGERKKYDLGFDLKGENRYYSRDVIMRSVFDLRRAIDFIENTENLDASRIGYFGISLGGVIGTILSGVDDRIQIPVIALAGGRMNFMFGSKAFSKSIRELFLPIDPIHFVRNISPRPLLMLNAREDEIIPPMTSKFLYRKAKRPKKIVWYDAKHRTLPLEEAFDEGIRWYKNHL